MFLAVKGNGLAAIAEIAKAYGISKSHLMKVVVCTENIIRVDEATESLTFAQ